MQKTIYLTPNLIYNDILFHGVFAAIPRKVRIMSEENTLISAENTLMVESDNVNKAIKKICSLALPMTGMQLISVASSFFCMIMLSRLGHAVLAASALIYSAQTSIMVIGMSMMLSLSILVGHSYGARKYTDIGSFLQQGWALAIFISIPIMILYWHIGKVLILFGESPQVAQIVQTFFHAYIWAVIPFQMVVCNQQLCYGINKQKLAICSSFLGVLILLISAYTFIFGKFGMPQLGVRGLGYAMAAQVWFAFIFTTVCFYFGKSFKQFDLFNYRIHKDWSNISKMFKFGWPISIQISGEMLSFFVNSLMIGWIGVVALAAYQVVIQCLFLILIPVFSLSQASGILVGQASGGKKFHEVKSLTYTSIGIVLVITMIVAVIFNVFPHKLASLYLNVNNPANFATVQLITTLFAIVAITSIFDGIRNVLTGCLRGLFDTRYPMFVGIFSIWLIGIPCSYLLAFGLHWGAKGIPCGSAIGLLTGLLVLLYRWRVMKAKYGL